MFCPACGREALEQTNFCQYCGHPLNPEAPGQATFAAPYAGFWRRCAAISIDEFLIYFVVVGAEAVVGAMLGLDIGLRGVLYGGKRLGTAFAWNFTVGTLIHWLYWAGMESSIKQATLGKMALGIVVTDLKGRPISFGRATGRYFGKIISALLFGIGFLMAGLTRKKQALHDLMAGTLVVQKRHQAMAEPGEPPKPEESLGL